MMSNDASSHQDYLDAFEGFLSTGDSAALAAYTVGERPAAFLSVYRNGFMRAAIGALESNFPSLQKLWGDEYFTQVASAYVNAAPPAAATLLGYGFTDTAVQRELEPALSFVGFLHQQANDLIKRYPYVPDVCLLDQAWLQVLNQDSKGVLTVEKVQQLIAQGQDLAELPIRLADAAQIVRLEFDIFELWGRLRFGELAENEKIVLAPLDNSVVFWQRELQVQAKPLSAVEAVFMQHLKNTADIDAAAQQALLLDEIFDISTLFADLLNAHLLAI